MPKVILIGSPQAQWDIDGSMKPGGVPIELTDKQLIKYSSIVVSFVKEEQEQPVEKILVEKLFFGTEKELYSLNKDQQIEILGKLGITKIPKTEKGRVTAILEAQQ